MERVTGQGKPANKFRPFLDRKSPYSLYQAQFTGALASRTAEATDREVLVACASRLTSERSWRMTYLYSGALLWLFLFLVQPMCQDAAAVDGGDAGRVEYVHGVLPGGLAVGIIACGSCLAALAGVTLAWLTAYRLADRGLLHAADTIAGQGA